MGDHHVTASRSDFLRGATRIGLRRNHALRCRHSKLADSVISIALRAFETGQFSFASAATFSKAAASIPGTEAFVVRSILVIANPAGTDPNRTFAVVCILLGTCPRSESAAASAIEKHPAWAAAISSSGL